MTPWEWLDCLGREQGASEPARYRLLAPVLRRVAPGLLLSRRTAASMALLLRGQYPTEGEFADALRQHLPSAVARRVLADGPIDPPAPAAPRVTRPVPDAEAEDRRFWLRRIDRLDAALVSLEVLRDAQGMWRVLTRPGAAERTEIVARLWAVVVSLERALGREGETAALAAAAVGSSQEEIPQRPPGVRPSAPIAPEVLRLMREAATRGARPPARMHGGMHAATKAKEETES